MSISYSLFKNIETYARLHAESSASHYQSRNQNTEKLFENCFRGKVAEWCNYHSLIDAGYIIEKPPCMIIFEQSEKSYDADLVILGKGKEIFDHKRYVHIKAVSLDSFKKFGASFLVENLDKLVHSPGKHHFISVMLQQDLINYKFYKWLDATQVRWGKPILKHLNSKSAWYEQPIN